MDPRYFFDFLYPFQDEVLRRLSSLDAGLYLTGGTAASRGYLKHRFSDDLDLFANDSDEFRLWTERASRRSPPLRTGGPRSCSVRNDSYG